MPRRRVPPDQRQRSSKACEACRATKKRCNDQAPCSNCLRRGLASSCTNLQNGTSSAHDLASSPTNVAAAMHIVTPESVVQAVDVRTESHLQVGEAAIERRQDKLKRRNHFQENRLRSQQSTRPASPAGDEADAAEAEHPRILLSARGEKGWSAAIVIQCYWSFAHHHQSTSAAQLLSPSCNSCVGCYDIMEESQPSLRAARAITCLKTQHKRTMAHSRTSSIMPSECR